MSSLGRMRRRAPGRPSLVRSVKLAFSLLWSGSPRLVITSVGLQVVTGLGLGAALLVANRILGMLVTEARLGPGMELVPYVAILVGLAGVTAFAGSAQMGARKLLVEHAIRHVRNVLLAAAAAVELEEFERAGFHERLERARRHAIMAPMGVADALFGLGMTLVVVIGVGGALLILAPVTVPIVFAGAIPMWILGARRGAALYQFSFGQSDNDRRRDALEDTLLSRGSVKEVRALKLSEVLGRRWDELYSERLRDEAGLLKRNLSRLAVGSAGSAVALGVALVALAILVANGTVAVAAGLTAAVSTQLLNSRLASAGASFADIYENTLYLQDFADLLGLSERDSAVHGDPGEFKSVELKSVSFNYPDVTRKALQSIDLTLRMGEVVALVGENGSGKTTLAKLISGLYRPTAGTVRWSGQDMAVLDRDEVRRHVAPIFQDFVRYPLSVAENIAVGDASRLDDREGIEAAAKRAGATEFIAKLPYGFDTLLMKEFSEGADLSGGEWQKIALARAFFRNAPFIILDEPTAALDATAEHEVFTSMRELARGRAVLLISHRFSTVRSADRILVIHNGSIVEDGSHDQLMNERGRYHRMFTLQAAQYASSANAGTGDGRHVRAATNAGASLD